MQTMTRNWIVIARTYQFTRCTLSSSTTRKQSKIRHITIRSPPGMHTVDRGHVHHLPFIDCMSDLIPNRALDGERDDEGVAERVV